jgi:arylformamidase
MMGAGFESQAPGPLEFIQVRIHDVSVLLDDGLAHWPTDPPFHRKLELSQARGDAANVSRLDLVTHAGTHVDAPYHFLEGGRTVEQLPLEVLVGACEVVHAQPSGLELTPADVPARPERLLIKTQNSILWSTQTHFQKSYVAVGEELARALVEDGVRLVGVDYLSVERFDAPFEHPVHRILLEAGVVVVEGLDLSRVQPGRYQLCCLPLKLAGSDGAPARVILVGD